jgi:hypothetical protein
VARDGRNYGDLRAASPAHSPAGRAQSDTQRLAARPEQPPPAVPVRTKSVDQYLEAFAGRGIKEGALVDAFKLIVNVRQFSRKRLDERARDTARGESLEWRAIRIARLDKRCGATRSRVVTRR